MIRRGARVAVASCLALFSVGARAFQGQSDFDLVITNARIVDGTGGPSRVGDVAIRDGKIIRIGKLGAVAAADRIDGTGLVLAPGFLDVHTHADDLASTPLAENFIRMGVTSIVAGNCGSSALDIFAEINGIRAARPTVNFATFIGHNTVRQAVMGGSQREPSIGDDNKMRSFVFRGMADGAIGLSTGLQYLPGIYARSSEIVDLARVAANEGGIYATHMRNEGTALTEAISETLRVGWLVNVPVEISHLKVDSPKQWGTSAAVLKMIDDARARGTRVQMDQYAYTAGASSLSIRFPTWALEGGAEKIKARLSDPVQWAKVKTDMQALLADRGFTDLSWATVAKYSPNPALNGKSMPEVAQILEGSSSPDAQLLAARDLMIGGGASMVYRFMSDDDVERIMRHPMVAFASDGSLVRDDGSVPHPRASGNNARVLGVYVREKKTITLEEAVRKMTSLPADFFGFAGRGTIREGAIADLVLFDPDRVRDAATYDHPTAYAEGIPHVIVNGQVVLRDGKMTGTRPGQILKRTPPTKK